MAAQYRRLQRAYKKLSRGVSLSWTAVGRLYTIAADVGRCGGQHGGSSLAMQVQGGGPGAAQNHRMNFVVMSS